MLALPGDHPDELLIKTIMIGEDLSVQEVNLIPPEYM